MPDYEKIIKSLENAERNCRSAEEGIVPVSAVKQVDAYLLGMLQTMRLILADAKRAAKIAAKSKSVPTKVLKNRLT